MATNATYTKLKSGAWGIRATISVQPGDRISVAKKSGESKTEIIDKVLFSKDGVSVCSVSGARSATTAGSSRNGFSSRMGSGHGQSAPVTGYSSYCTDNAACRCFDCARKSITPQPVT